MQVSKRKIGGTAIIGGGLWFGRETLSWVVGSILDLFTDQAGNMDLSQFPWADALALTLVAVGAFLAFWPENKPIELAKEAADMAGKLDKFRDDGFPDRANNSANLTFASLSLLTSFKKAGYPVFEENELPDDAIDLLAVCRSYFKIASNFISAGHLKEAKGHLSQIVESNRIDQ